MRRSQTAATILAVERRFEPAELELMDRPQPVSAELERDLHNLRQLNRFFGSYGLILHFLRRWIRPKQEYRILDLATGSGDIPRLVVDYARSIRATVSMDAIDGNSATLEIARNLSGNYPEISYQNGNLLEFANAFPYDIVLCSLVLHHFSNEDAVRVLRRCRDLSRQFVLVSDLRRGLLASAGVYLLTAFIFREPMTRYDGRLSAARAFSFNEIHNLAERAAWVDFRHERFRFARQAIWMELADAV
jgi:2-polyprenyl-3-methyl-5-hydroxy-6-metoxy-1,4-benzoquinol methylase